MLDLLFDGKQEAIESDISRLTQSEGFSVNLHIGHFEKNPLERSFSSQSQIISVSTNRVELFRIYRHYLLESGDISTAMGPLTTMKPEKLDFNPHSFQYGGMFLYPFALILKMASWIRYLHLTPDINFYILNPLEFRKFGLLGRGWMAAVNILSAIILFYAAREWENTTVGILSVIFFLLFPNSLAVARTLKPHEAALIWILMSFWSALRFQNSGKSAYLWGSAVMSGFAVGTSLNYGIFVLFPIVALLNRERRVNLKDISRIVGIVFCVFVVTNPYFFVSLGIIRTEFAYHHWIAQNGSNQKIIPVLFNIFPRGMTWWLSLGFFLSLLFYVRQRSFSRQILLIVPLIYFLAFLSFGGGNRAVRFVNVLYPYFGMICAYGLSEVIHRWRRTGVALTIGLLAFTLMSATNYLSNYWAESAGESTLYQAGRWINNLPNGTSIGFSTLPTPGVYPPFRFQDFNLLIFPDSFAAARSTEETPAYFVSHEGMAPKLGAYQLVQSFKPIVFVPQSWFGPDPIITDVAPSIFIFKRI